MRLTLLLAAVLFLAACGRDPVAPPAVFCEWSKVAVPGVDQFGRPLTDTLEVRVCSTAPAGVGKP